MAHYFNRYPGLEGDVHMVKNGIILLAMVLFIPCTARAANLYLKDGGYIECFLARQQGDVVYLLINRDTEIELDRSAVAIKKTFKNKKSIGSYRRYKKSLHHRPAEFTGNQG